MWRIMGILFFADKDIFVDKSHKCFRQKEIMQFARETGIAIYDIAEEVHRLKDNASDAYLEVIRPTAISTLLNQLPQCRAIVATGEKATRGIITSHHISIPQIGKSVELHINGHTLPLYRMPSTSRAYPLPIEQKAAYYHSMFQELGML